MPEDEIVTQGRRGDRMYFLARGDCECIVYDEFKQPWFQHLLKPGCHFGEVALLYNTLRTATVRAKNYITVAALDRPNFDELIMNFPETVPKFKEVMNCYDDK